MAAAGDCAEDDLFAMVRRAAPYADLDRAAFDEVVELASWGITTGRGRRGAHLHRDGVNGRLRPRRGARLAALTSGGAIPETGDYRVVLDPDGVTVGSVHEDFAVEANIGDVFLLGTHSWRVRKVEVGTVRVDRRRGRRPHRARSGWARPRPARPSCPRRCRPCAPPWPAAWPPATGPGPGRWWWPRAGVGEDVADQVVAYLAAGLAALGVLPTQDRLVVERFFDDIEGSQLVVHAPYGGRINRALGLALRKRFCVSFDFELQAAADDDTVILSLGPQHSFPLAQVPKMLSSATVGRRAGPGRAAPPDAGRPVAVEPATGPWSCPGPAAASAGPSTSSAWRPTTCWPRPGRRWPPARRTPRPARSPCPTTCWCARRWTTA